MFLRSHVRRANLTCGRRTRRRRQAFVARPIRSRSVARYEDDQAENPDRRLADRRHRRRRGDVPSAHEHDHEVHPGDPVKQEEHTALFDLVADSEATHVAVADGAWGDPKTWDKGTVPGAGARVVIPSGPNRHRRRPARQGPPGLGARRWHAALRPDRPTPALKVVTLVGNVEKHHRDRHREGAHPRRQDRPA